LRVGIADGPVARQFPIGTYEFGLTADDLALFLSSVDPKYRAVDTGLTEFLPFTYAELFLPGKKNAAANVGGMQAECRGTSALMPGRGLAVVRPQRLRLNASTSLAAGLSKWLAICPGPG
jgi:hypothetical protein